MQADLQAETGREAGRQAGRQLDIYTDRETKTETDRQADRQAGIYGSVFLRVLLYNWDTCIRMFQLYTLAKKLTHIGIPAGQQIDRQVYRQTGQQASQIDTDRQTDRQRASFSTLYPNKQARIGRGFNCLISNPTYKTYIFLSAFHVYPCSSRCWTLGGHLGAALGDS